ncbi:MAG: hypothetical protein ABI910_23385 [Gemmatimonadota bacterium]
MVVLEATIWHPAPLSALASKCCTATECVVSADGQGQKPSWSLAVR